MSRFALRYQAMDVNLGPEELIAGRVEECGLVLDDALVSRRHASFRVVGDKVEVRDLGSRNGVLVNGVRIEGPTALKHGDRVRIGSQELLLRESSEQARPSFTSELVRCGHCGGIADATETLCQGCGATLDDVRTQMDPRAVDAPEGGHTASVRSSLRVLSRLTDKALGLGRNDEAERLVTTMRTHVSERAPADPDDESVATVTAYATKLADHLQKPSWLDFVIETYASCGQLMSPEQIDELYRVASKLHYTNPRPIRSYVAKLKSDSAALGASQRFLLQRLEGLERRIVSG